MKNSHRWIGHALSALAGGAAVWILSTHDGPDVAGFEQQVPAQRWTQEDSLSSDRSSAVSAQIEDLESALSEAREEINRLAAALITAESESGDLVPSQDVYFVQPLPGGYDWKDGSDGMIEVFESETRDDRWAPDLERQLTRSINFQAADRSVSLASQEIECRTYVCRISLMHGSMPGNREELTELADSATAIARQLVRESSELTGAHMKHRGGYPGEPTTSELLLFRSGTGVINLSPAALDTPFEE